ncbi:MAG TPA: exonuclease domain-containing protein [Terrimesophilobacter sp.]|nr:exonuclease domain-containing protein [Terrimesophilobacter sp.]
MSGPGFAVIDFETTGLSPAKHDRVIEVAVVHVDEYGLVEGQWETLVNPGRDLGRQDIHHIRASDVMRAPAFEQIAPRLIELLAGRVLVAHNASFDTRFLLAELELAGYRAMPDLVALCTMQLARDFLPGAGRSLADCCAAYDIDLVDAHRASVDALATAQLLGAYIRSTDDREFWFSRIGAALDQSWPPVSAASTGWMPRPSFDHPVEVTAQSFLSRITIKMPEYAGPAECLNYLALLDNCLLDRHLSAHEAEALVVLAEELGIDRNTVESLHLEYFDELTKVAWGDGVLTTGEMADLVEVGNLLDLSTVTITRAFVAPTTPSPLVERSSSVGPNSPVELAETRRPFTLAPGDLIVLTGEMSHPRSDWEARLASLGFIPWPAVTKKVKLLAAADPDSLSGKARKARDYGIPIVDEAGLERLLAK